MFIFKAMAMAPWPFIILLPAVMVVLTVLGWTRSGIIENEVAKIWVREGGAFSKDKDYADSIGKGDATTSTFVSMALSRDGGNILTASRLEEIRARMEVVEGTTVSQLL